MTRSVLAAIAALAALATCAAPAHAIDRGDLEKVQRIVGNKQLLDCKAFAHESVARLRKLGITARFIAVQTETGGYHAIAVVGNHYALDSRERFVTTISDLRAKGYRIAALTGNTD